MSCVITINKCLELVNRKPSTLHFLQIHQLWDNYCSLLLSLCCHCNFDHSIKNNFTFFSNEKIIYFHNFSYLYKIPLNPHCKNFLFFPLSHLSLIHTHKHIFSHTHACTFTCIQNYLWVMYSYLVEM